MTQGLTPQMTAAFEMARQAHDSQNVAGADLSYLFHLLDVCSIALQFDADEDQAVAALLHTSVKHGGGMARANEIGTRFGERVKSIVLECADCVIDDGVKTSDWWTQKISALDHLHDASPDALLVLAADKLSGARTIVTDVGNGGERAWSRCTAGRVGALWYYRSVARILPYRLAGDANGRYLSRVFDGVVEEMVLLVGVEQAELDWNVALEHTAAAKTT